MEEDARCIFSILISKRETSVRKGWYEVEEISIRGSFWSDV